MATQVIHWSKKLPALKDHALRAHFATCELYDRTPELIAESFNEICVQIDGRSHSARQVLSAFLPTIVSPEHLPRVTEVRSATHRAELPAAKRLLRCSHADGHHIHVAAKLGRQSDGVVERDGKALTLGERRALARQPSRALLCKLLRDPHPMVAKILLHNPRVTEGDVVSMSSRRPAIIPVIYEVAASWAHHGRVRMAIVLNPGSPTAVSAPLLTLLMRPELVAVTHAMNLPPVLRATADELLALRPPMKNHNSAALIH